MYHPPCLVRVVVVTVCKVDWYTVWIPWFVMCHCPSECIGMRDLRKCDKESWFPEVCYRRSALARWLGDKIADLLEYFLGSYSKFSSTFYNKRLEVCVVQGLIRLKVFKIFCFFPGFGSVEWYFRCLSTVRFRCWCYNAEVNYSTFAVPSCLTKWNTSISMRSPASCFVGFRLDTSDMDGAVYVVF